MPASRRGRGWIITGSLLIAVSVLVGVVGTGLTVGRIDFSEFDRDIVFKGDPVAQVPGELSFSVDDALDTTTDGSMTVGIAIRSSSPTAPRPTCTLATVAGGDVPLSSNLFDTELYRDDGVDFDVVGSARLKPSDYVASCDFPGEPSAAPGGTTFTAGRTLGSDEFDDTFGPILGFFGVLALGGFMFVLGVVLLIVGLVMRSRSNRPPAGPYGGQPYGGQPYGRQQPYGGQPHGGQPYGSPPDGPGPVYPAPPPGWQPPPPTGPPVGPPVGPPAAPPDWGPPVGAPPVGPPPEGQGVSWPTPPGRA